MRREQDRRKEFIWLSDVLAVPCGICSFATTPVLLLLPAVALCRGASGPGPGSYAVAISTTLQCNAKDPGAYHWRQHRRIPLLPRGTLHSDGPAVVHLERSTAVRGRRDLRAIFGAEWGAVGGRVWKKNYIVLRSYIIS
jgi:hypothetical protein